jgi:hypothetical protein
MVDLPFINLPPSEPIDRAKGKPAPRGGGMAKPGRAAQVGRVGPRLQRLKQRFASPAGVAELRADPASIAPERALVFELSEINPTSAYTALKNIPGFEFLGEDEDEMGPPEHGFVKLDKKGQPSGKPISHRLYFAMPSDDALRAMLALWDRYERNEPFDAKATPGLTGWRDVFDNLIDVRPWGPEDRVPEEAIEAWKADLAEFPDEVHRIEVELWYRANPDAQKKAGRKLKERIEAAGGRVLIERVIEEIFYHGALIEVSAAELRRLADDKTGDIATIDEVMFFRPQTLAAIPRSVLPNLPAYPAPPEELESDDMPVVALFDGMPVVGHTALSGRLLLDDPEAFADRYASVSEMQHGTAMASIVLNGDGHAPTPVTQRLYVRPVLVPDGQDERFPPDDLALFTLHEALQRMLVGVTAPDGTQLVPPASPNVCIINLSIGDPNRRFGGIVSPWARLIDHYAFRHRILFIVSAGNIRDPLEIKGVATYAALEDMDASERTEKVLGAIFANRAYRKLLSPAEAINALTVGARHSDRLPPEAKGAGHVDPFAADNVSNVSSALGGGAIRCIKPEILMDGGRETLQLDSAGDGVVKVKPVSVTGRFFGIGAAAPGLRGELDRMMNSSGTSPAAALATHQALRIEQALRGMDGMEVGSDHLSVVLKALMAHSAGWDQDVAAMIEAHTQAAGLTAWQHRRVEKGRFLGLGVPQVGRVLGCTLQRALVLGYGEIEKEKTIPHAIPLPKELSAIGEWRAVTATLAWLTPIHPRHGAYRRSALDLELEGFQDGTATGAEKVSEQPHEAMGNKGTLIHRRWEGTDPAVFLENQGIRVNVSCRTPTNGLDEKIPYALAVTLEVGEASAIDVYTDIKVKVEARVPIVIRTEGT